MANTVSLQPMLTGNALGGFSVQSDGYVQGVALDDPAIRNSLAGGNLAIAETLAMIGGLPLFEKIHPATNNGILGNTVGRATVATGIQGWSVYNQANAFITTPQSNAPSAGAGATIPYYRTGSKARIAVPIDPVVAAGLLDGTTSPADLYWDVTALVINLTSASNISLAGIRVVDVQIGNSKTVAYDAVNNVFNFVNTGSVAIIEI